MASILPLKKEKPVIRIKKPTKRAERYSILPYPRGCSFVGRFLLNLYPINVTKDERLSVALFAPSEITATEPER